jgi:hypothetical protein
LKEGRQLPKPLMCKKENGDVVLTLIGALPPLSHAPHPRSHAYTLRRLGVHAHDRRSTQFGAGRRTRRAPRSPAGNIVERQVESASDGAYTGQVFSRSRRTRRRGNRLSALELVRGCSRPARNRSREETPALLTAP